MTSSDHYSHFPSWPPRAVVCTIHAKPSFKSQCFLHDLAEAAPGFYQQDWIQLLLPPLVDRSISQGNIGKTESPPPQTRQISRGNLIHRCGEVIKTNQRWWGRQSSTSRKPLAAKGVEGHGESGAPPKFSSCLPASSSVLWHIPTKRTDQRGRVCLERIWS